MSEQPRYFVDHDTLHDSATGKHLDLQEAADLLSAEPEDTNRIAWGVVIELGRQLKVAAEEVNRLGDELRALRLTDADREALEWLRQWDGLDGHAPNSSSGAVKHRQALSVLNRLLSQGGAK